MQGRNNSHRDGIGIFEIIVAILSLIAMAVIGAGCTVDEYLVNSPLHGYVCVKGHQ